MKFSGDAVFVRLRRELLVIAAIVVAGMGFLAGIDTWLHYQNELEEIETHTTNLGRSLSDHAERLFRLADLALQTTIQNLNAHSAAINLETNAPMLAMVLRRQVEAFKELQSVAIADEHGRLLTSTPENGSFIHIDDRDYFQTHHNQPDAGLVISGPYVSRVNQKPILVLSRRLNHPDGQFAGVVLALVQVEVFEALYHDIQIGTSGLVSLWRDDGVLLAENFSSLKLDRAATLQEICAIVSAEIAQGKRQGLLRIKTQKENFSRSVGFRRLSFLPVHLIVAVADCDYLEQWRSFAIIRLFTFSAVLCVILFLVALLNRHTRHVQEIAKLLRQNEQKFRAIFNSSLQFTGLLSPEGVLLEINQTLCVFAGIAPEDAVGRFLWDAPWWPRRADALDEAFRDHLQDLTRRAAAGAFVRKELNAVGVNGVAIIDFSLKPVHDEHGHVVTLIPEGRDITERKRAEETLRQSEERLRRMVEHLPAGAVHVSGDVLRLNRAAEQITGYAREELPTLNAWFLALHGAEAEKAHQDYLSDHADAFPRPRMISVRRKDGRTRMIERTAYGVAEETIWLLTDCTDRLYAKQALRNMAARLGTLIAVLPDMAFIIDHQGRCQEILRKEDALLVVPETEMIGAHIQDFMPWPIGAELLALIMQSLTTKQRQSMEYALDVPAGAVWFETLVAPLPDDFGPQPSTLMLIRDVTSRKRAEQALLESERRYALAIQGARDGIWDWDLETGTIYFSPGWFQMLGYVENELPPSWESWNRVILPEDFSTVRNVFENSISGAANDMEIAFRCLTRNGALRYVHARGQISRSADGIAYRVTGTLADETAMRQTEDYLRQAKFMAEAANQAKSQFLANMSHELRTPLNAVIGFSEILAAQAFGPLGSERYTDYAHDIHASGLHLLALINNLLDMSKIDAGLYLLQKEPINLLEMIGNCVSLAIVDAHKAELDLIWSPPQTLPVIHADHWALQQIFMNILSNAIKFTPSGGRVLLEAGITDDKFLTIKIADTGIGIEPTALTHVLEPFQQADMTISRPYGGTGLGLPISYNLLRLHEGHLDIESTVGVGTIVTIHLPLDDSRNNL
ncbi:two-component system, cell cycle sensor histidine kinase PleC [Azospirillaceae bacterium]